MDARLLGLAGESSAFRLVVQIVRQPGWSSCVNVFGCRGDEGGRADDVGSGLMSVSDLGAAGEVQSSCSVSECREWWLVTGVDCSGLASIRLRDGGL